MPKWYYGEVHEVDRDGGPVDPGYGQRPPGNRPGNDLPGRPIHHPGHPDHGRPDNSLPGQGGRPSHPWAPPGQGGHPDQGLPGGGGSPDQGLPELPPEVGIWPPPSASHPIVPVPPDHALPPGSIYPPLPDHARGKFLVLAWISGEHEKSGWHYVVVDSDAKPDHSLPGGGQHPSGQPLPPGGRPPAPGQRPPQGGQPPARPGQPGGRPISRDAARNA